MNRGLKIGAGQRSRSMALAKWIAASGDENVEDTASVVRAMHENVKQDHDFFIVTR